MVLRYPTRGRQRAAHNDFGNVKFNAKCGRACFVYFVFGFCSPSSEEFGRCCWLGLLFFCISQVCAFVERDIPRSLKRRINCGWQCGGEGEDRAVRRQGRVKWSFRENDNLFIFLRRSLRLDAVELLFTYELRYSNGIKVWICVPRKFHFAKYIKLLWYTLIYSYTISLPLL